MLNGVYRGNFSGSDTYGNPSCTWQQSLRGDLTIDLTARTATTTIDYTSTVSGLPGCLPGVSFNFTAPARVTAPTQLTDGAVIDAWGNWPDPSDPQYVFSFVGTLTGNAITGTMEAFNMVNGADTLHLPTTLTLQAEPKPGQLQFSAAGYTAGENAGTTTITVRRSDGSDGTVTVAYATSTGTAPAADYAPEAGTLSFAAGETSKSFGVSVRDNDRVDGNRTVNLTLSNPTGGATLGSPSTAVLSILDDEAPTARRAGQLQFSAAAYTTSEDAGTVTIGVTRTGGSDGAITVAYATSNGTAPAGDYTPAAGTFSFASGETGKTFAVSIRDNERLDGNRTVNLTLSNPTGGSALGSPSTAVVNIVDDEGPNRLFVNAVYQDLLFRAAEPEGLEFWTGFLEGGSARGLMVQAVVNSVEYVRKLVDGQYGRFLCRTGDPAGANVWSEFLRLGGTLDQLRVAFLGSAEYFARAGNTVDGFLQALYADVLNRAIDPGGAQVWRGALAGGATRVAVALSVLLSLEGRGVQVDGLYNRYLRRDADTGGRNLFVNVLGGGVPYQAVVAVLVGSDESFRAAQRTAIPGQQRVVEAATEHLEAHKGLCNTFVNAVAKELSIRTLENKDANGIVRTLRNLGDETGSGVEKLGTDGRLARERAEAGYLVIGGLQATPNGHVVVVVPGPLAHGKYPTAFWGSLSRDTPKLGCEARGTCDENRSSEYWALRNGKPAGTKTETVNYAWPERERDRVEYFALRLTE